MMFGQKVGQSGASVPSQNDFGAEIGLIDLAHELPAHPTGRQNIEIAAPF